MELAYRIVNSKGTQIGPLYHDWDTADKARNRYKEGKRGAWKKYRIQTLEFVVIAEEPEEI
ncbi:hypothetical protein CPT_Mendera_287 [Stenotrophomonas phage Mendera]|uniref:Uncharacterized protein n=1 Tax=Stenotrophomonas phage Mendera TaxID=2650877 RepID=A0A5P8PJE6_9CAUD|nr:hypothetical protein HWC60_gp128 [Stenotrophomonas phage Mendera]QFR56813.1 hypothetical protein CPT_Mendera_287 [Stenotrophomonas phage Mendera]